MPSPPSDAQLALWLADRVRVAGRLPQAAVLSGLGSTAAIMGQAYSLAAFFQGLVLDHKSLTVLWPWVAVLALSSLLRALLLNLKDRWGIEASLRVREALRRDAVDAVGRLGPAWKASVPSGTLAARLHEQIDGLDAYVARYLAQQKLAIGGPVLILAAVFPLNWICGLILVATAPLIPLFMILVGKGAAAVQTRQLRSLDRMSGHFLDVLRGLTTLKLLDAHRRQAAKVAAVTEDFRVRTMEVLRLAFLSSTMLEFFAVLAIALTALYLGFTLLGQIHLGVALVFQTALFVLVLAPDFYQPLRDLGTLYHARAEALACAAQLWPLFNTPSPSVEGGSEIPPVSPPRVELDGVSFAYRQDAPVLTDFSFVAAPGEAVAITGPSGVGKTTILRLILGQLQADSGTVRVHGRPVQDWDMNAWRSQVGWLSQHPRLLSGTLRENLTATGPLLPDDDLLAALAWAGLEPWAARLPRGLDTLLGEGGRQVSGGQLRRLALARLRVKPSTILLLDEPTASLDDATEAWVVDRLREFREGRTVVLLTHHPRPLVLADRIVSLEGPGRP